MIVCSCNVVDTDMIRDCLKNNPDFTAKQVIEHLGWKVDCSTCVYNLIEEINKEIRNG